MNNIDLQYQSLLNDILSNGKTKSDRTGTGTTSVFGRQIRHKMSEGFPLLTTKKMHWNSVVTELLWFLRGDTNIKFLLDYDCHIWDGDAYKNYLKNSSTSLDGMFLSKEEFIYHVKNNKEWGEKWGDLGPIYGKQWRKWKYQENEWYDGHTHYPEISTSIDQISNLVQQLKTNPDSRRLIVSAWNVAELGQMILPPCHYGFQVYTRELNAIERMEYYGKHYMKETETKSFDELLQVDYDEYNVPKRAISLMWNQRSVDTFLGLPFNIASYALLLEIFAREVNMVPENLIGNLGDVHLYSNHIEQAKEQISREPYDLPSVQITERNWYLHEAVKEHLGEKTFNEKIMSYRPECFELLNYQSHPKIKAPLSN
jgi:thymidylate synthase